MQLPPDGLMARSFNAILIDLVEQLSAILPTEEQPRLRQYHAALQMLDRAPSTAQRELPLRKFMERAGPWRDQITSHDVEFFRTEGARLFADERVSLDMGILAQYWDRMDTQTQDGIWQMVSMLLNIGTVVTTMPSGVLQQAESLARQLIGGGGGGAGPAIAGLLDAARRGGGLGGAGGGGGAAGLLGLLGSKNM